MKGVCLYLLGTSYQPPRVGYGAPRTEENQQPQPRGGGYGQPQSHQHDSQRYKGGRGERTLLPTPPTLPTSDIPVDHEGRPYDSSPAARGRKRKRMSRWEPHEEQRGEWCFVGGGGGGGVAGVCISPSETTMLSGLGMRYWVEWNRSCASWPWQSPSLPSRSPTIFFMCQNSTPFSTPQPTTWGTSEI